MTIYGDFKRPSINISNYKYLFCALINRRILEIDIYSIQESGLVAVILLVIVTSIIGNAVLTSEFQFTLWIDY